MQPDFIPNTDIDLATWSTNFRTQLTAGPTDIGAVAGDATAYATLDTAYQSALTAATDPSTRTATTISTKVDARTALVADARRIAKIARGFDPADDVLVRFGLNTDPDGQGAPIAAPATRPLVQLVGNASQTLTIKLRDELTPTTQAKPEGSTAAEIWVKVSETNVPPASVADCAYVGDATRNPYNLSFDPADETKRVFVIARWKTARGLVGPESEVLSTCIAP